MERMAVEEISCQNLNKRYVARPKIVNTSRMEHLNDLVGQAKGLVILDIGTILAGNVKETD